MRSSPPIREARLAEEPDFICMIHRVFIFALLAYLPAIVRAADAPDDAPAGALLLGIDCNAGDVVDDPAALGGKAASSGGEYHPLISAKIPESGDSFTIWAHRKSGPVQLKAIINGGQQEKLWNWAAPADYEWCSLGRYARADLGDGIVIIRAGKQNDPNPAIDCIVFSTDPAAHPKGVKADGSKEIPPESPDDAIAATHCDLQINWSKNIGEFTRSTWGVNDYEILDPKNAASPEYQAFLASVHPGFIRIHNGGLVDQWTDPATRSWRVDQIKAGFAASTGFAGAKIMLNIPTWPNWLATAADGTLTPQSENEFVALVGKLVQVMHNQLHQKIDYWELLNERDDQFEKLGKLAQLWNLHNRLYAQIKQQDPTAKVGGPAFTWPKQTWVESFLAACGPNVDFITWHNYASGDIYDSNPFIFDRVNAMADQAQYMKTAVAKAIREAIPGRHVELFLDEYNIKWTWDPIERRHGNNVGAVFQASLLRRMGMLGLDGVAVWQAKGHAYGLIDGDNTIRSTGRLYQIGSRCLVGDMVDATATTEPKLKAIAVRRSDAARSILLINQADHSVVLTNAGQLDWPTGHPAMTRIASDGFYSLDYSKEVRSGAMSLPGYSVTLLTEDQSLTAIAKEAK